MVRLMEEEKNTYSQLWEAGGQDQGGLYDGGDVGDEVGVWGWNSNILFNDDS